MDKRQDSIYTIGAKDNHEIIEGLKLSLGQERRSMADGLLFLGAFQERRLYLKEAYPNAFTYLTKALNLSKSSASKRLAVARAIRLFPKLYDLIAEGEIHLSGAYLISKVLCQGGTPERAQELIQMARRRTKEEIEMELARLYPQDVQKSWARGFQLTFSSPIPDTAPSLSKNEAVSPGNLLEEKTAKQKLFNISSTISGEPREKAKPVSSSLVRLAVNLDKEAYQILKRLQALAPAKDMGEILSEALHLLQKKKDPQKKAESFSARKAAKEKKTAPSVKRPYISTKVKNLVYLRDQGQCTYVNEAGARCPAKEGLHLDHIIPFAKGGKTDLENLRLRCQGHNLDHAFQSFGESFIQQKIDQVFSQMSDRQKQGP